ncbi:hypothetical protein BDV95DRAFT_596572 [Massariosphaeria phaeospora]|uniref:DUF6604 domain-containing protein n=1 Tax=Massariosphaeria phaeospora TaxID=100035 RepID=A0A7C8I9Z7_9PLEO|nr:hypothetical protein BDV95DRAFT_596572 [Massariosphaeria phaeospora]
MNNSTQAVPLSDYRQYKEDTRYIAGFLAEASKNDSKDEQKANPKRKGARKGKKNHRTAGKGAGNKQPYIIKVSDFVPMTEKIVQNKSSTFVPVALSRVFNRVIQIRRKVSEQFKLMANSDEDSNKQHRYFIGILQESFRILRSSISSGPDVAHSESQDTEHAAEPLALRNRFANLTIEEIADIAEHEEAEESSLPAVAEVVFQQDESEKEEEFWFAFGVFLQELQSLRDIASETWLKYKQGEVDLVVAAMVTDTAIKLAQRAEAEFDTVVERPNSGLKMYLTRDMKGPKNIAAIVPKDLRKDTVHTYTLGAIEFAQTIRIMKEGKHPVVWDLVSQGVMNMFDEHKICIWVAFGVTLHLDSQDILGDSCGRSLFELESHLNKLIRKSNQMAERKTPFFRDGYKGVNEWTLENLGEGLVDCQSWTSKTGFDGQWTSLLLKPKVASHPVLKKLRKEENSFLKRHPLLCGMMKYDLYLRYHAAGIKSEKQTSAICMMGHIYVAGRLLQPNSPGWPDMDLVLYAQDPERLFMGDFPRTLEQAQKKFSLIIGSSAVNSARDTPLSRLKVDFNKMRDFKDTSVFLEGVYFSGVTNDQDLMGGVGHGTLDKMVNRVLQTMRTDARQPWGRLAKQLITSEDNDGAAQMTISASKSISHKQVLEKLAIWLQADTVDLFFDWFDMHRVCEELWAGIFEDFERDPAWDKEASNGMKPAVEPCLEILTRDRRSPNWLDLAYQRVSSYFLGTDSETVKSSSLRGGDRYIRTMAKNHKKTAHMLEAPGGPLSLETLHSHWPLSWWQPQWEALKSAPEDDNHELKDMFMESFFEI